MAGQCGLRLVQHGFSFLVLSRGNRAVSRGRLGGWPHFSNVPGSPFALWEGELAGAELPLALGTVVTAVVFAAAPFAFAR